MKSFNVCGLGNAVVDIFLELDDDEFASLGFERGTMRLVELEEQQELLNQFHDGKRDLTLVSGGSVANSVIAVSQLGGKSAFIGCVGDDRYGLHYAEEFEGLKIDMGNPVLVGERTGTCLAIITQDAERTMRTCLAVSSHLAARHIDRRRIESSEWLFIEGYVFANPETGQLAIREAIQVAKDSGTKIALTCSDAFIPEVFGDAFREALVESDLVFCNAPESVAITKAANTQEASEMLATMVPNSVVTDGANGAFVRYQGESFHVPAVASTPKDLTGAGDMFAGAFLYGITNGHSAEQSARGANFLCHKVITQVGARLQSGASDYWNESIG